MIHRKASTLQFHKVQGSKQTLRLQEAKFGVPPFHDPKGHILPTLQVSWFQNSMDEGIHIVRVPKPKTPGKAWGSPVQVSDLQKVESSRVLEIQGCRILRLHGSKVQRLQGSRNPTLQVSMVSKLQDFRVPGFAGDLAEIPFRKFSSNLSRAPQQNLRI